MNMTLQAALNEVAATILFENNGTTTSDLMRNMVSALGEIDWSLYKVRSAGPLLLYIAAYILVHLQQLVNTNGDGAHR
jgi:hypothetical protein